MRAIQFRLSWIPAMLLAVCLSAVAPCEAVIVETDSRLLTADGSCERAGTVKLTFDRNDADKIVQRIPFSDNRYVVIRVFLESEGMPQVIEPPLCEFISGNSSGPDVPELPNSGSLVPLDELNIEVSDTIVTDGSPDISAWAYGEAGNNYFEIYITFLQGLEIGSDVFWEDPTRWPWLKVGLVEEVSEGSAINVVLSDFQIDSLLKVTPSAFLDGQPSTDIFFSAAADDPTPFQIGHFQIDGAIPTEERNALIALYESTNGLSWTNSSNWLGEPGTECEWFGVDCDPETNHVMGIGLDYNNLVGPLPVELGNLTQLKFLSLGGNQLSGGIPTELGNLSNLEEIHLYENELTGAIPSSFGNLTGLKVLALYTNRLSGAIPPELGNLESLEYLYLADNALTGQIPASLGDASNLLQIHLFQNQLSGDIPTTLGTLPNLTELKLGGNQLTGGIPPGLGNLSQLTVLDLAENQLTGVIPAELGNLSQLKELLLYMNALSGEIPVQLGDLSQLEVLMLGTNSLTGGIPSELGNLSNLIYLKLYDNQMSGAIPAELGNLSNLEELWLNENQLSGTIPASLGNLVHLINLNMADNQLTGTIPPELAGASNLALIYLPHNQLEGSIPPELGNMGSLRELVLHNNHLAGTIPAEIGGLASLEKLLLDSNLLTGPLPESLLQLTSLIDGESEFRWNAFYTDNQALREFLNSKQSEGDWESTQTVAPTGLTAEGISESEIAVSWTPIIYTDGNTGSGYEIEISQTAEGPYELMQTTPDKETSAATVASLLPETTYYVRLRTVTAHFYNTIRSEYTTSVTAATLAGPAPPAPAIPPEELTALTDLYNATAGSEWMRQDGWFQEGVSPCDWYGVECGENHVVSLSLDTNNLTGTIPASIGNLTQLTTLSMSGNNLTSTLPPEMANLTNLQILSLGENAIGGGIPEWMGNLGRLKNLDLGYNQLSGPVPAELGNLSQLTGLYLQNNRLDGQLPESLGQLTTLEYLNIADNGLQGAIPPSVLNLQALKDNESDFRYNRLFIDPPDPGLKAFLDQKQMDGEWQSYQYIQRSRFVASGETAADFAMVSFVIKPDDPSADAVFGDDIGAYDTEIHRIGTYDPLLDFGTYREFDNGLEIIPGKAYWMFIRDGATLTIQGNPVSLNEDQVVPLSFNTESGDGWNMIACPNQAFYRWDEVFVVALDGSGAPMASTAVALGDAEAGTMIYKQRIWRWRQGDDEYTYYAPPGAPEGSLHPFDSDPYLAAGEGYWVRALQPNLGLWFKKEYQYARKPDDVLMAMRNKAKSWLGGRLTVPSVAAAADDESPPAPIAGFSSDPASRVDGSGGGGCFIRSLSDR